MPLTDADTDRIGGREWAEDVLAELTDASDAFLLGFWRRLKRELPTQEIDPSAMTDEEAGEFGKSVVNFGKKYLGWRVHDVPLEHWEWLADANGNIQRYLRNRRIVAERESDS